jgi:hypothetical protein
MGPSSKRPSPALVVSIIALLVALGGSAYAASKIGTKQIKNNAVTTAKIKARAITTAKLRNGAVTGAKVKESTLGVVPSATNAQNAVSAQSALSATNAQNAVNAVAAESAQTAVTATNFSRYFTSGLRKANTGETITLASAGPFTFFGECLTDGALAYVTTSEPESFMYSYPERETLVEGHHLYEARFEPGSKAKLGYAPVNEGPEWIALFEEEIPWTVASPDGGLLLRGYSSEGVHVFGADCAFALSWIDEA